MNQRAAFSRDLLAELPLWEQKGWISPEQAARLRQQYALAKPHSGAWWQLVLSLFAVLCVSAGVIALFAANWAALSREVRIVLSLTPLLLAQLAVLYAIYARPDSTAWRECSALTLALAVGAAIALIAQTYHIESDLPAFLRVWLWLALPLPFLTRGWAVAFSSLCSRTSWVSIRLTASCTRLMCSGAGSIRPICWRCSPCFCGNDNAAAIITTSTTPGELSPQATHWFSPSRFAAKVRTAISCRYGFASPRGISPAARSVDAMRWRSCSSWFSPSSCFSPIC